MSPYRETVIYCVSRPGQGRSGIFERLKRLKTERSESRASRTAS